MMQTVKKVIAWGRFLKPLEQGGDRAVGEYLMSMLYSPTNSGTKDNSKSHLNVYL